MDPAAVLDGLVELGSDDWVALWMIVDDVKDELDPDSDEQTLELTIMLVRRLLERGLLAGDAPVNSALRFNAWPNQQPSIVEEHIRRQWRERAGSPDWGDSPWFAMPIRTGRHA
jgi:hypothetical protein